MRTASTRSSWPPATCRRARALDAAWPGWAAGVAEVVAADGGLARVAALGLVPTVLVGDLDSADPRLLAAAEETGVRGSGRSRDKDESDTELARARGGPARRVAAHGPRRARRSAVRPRPRQRLAAGAGRARGRQRRAPRRPRAGHAPHRPGPGWPAGGAALPGAIGAIVSLLPFGGDVAGVTTRGLRYPLRDEALVPGPARGLSNVRTRRRGGRHDPRTAGS